MPLLEVLGRNRTLRSLDITGQQIGDVGKKLSQSCLYFFFDCCAKNAFLFVCYSFFYFHSVGAFALANALRSNRALRELRLDDNGITFDGFEALSRAVSTNYTLKFFEWPARDVNAALLECSKAPKGSRHTAPALLELLVSE